jgi:hypothetical protein
MASAYIRPDDIALPRTLFASEARRPGTPINGIVIRYRLLLLRILRLVLQQALHLRGLGYELQARPAHQFRAHVN